MTIDLVALAVLVLAAIAGAFSGALRQAVQLGAVALGWLAARHLGAAVARGLSGHLPALVARPVAAAVLFAGVAVLAAWTGHGLLRTGGLSRAVRGPADRAAGALLGGAKAALVVWVLLSALALAGGAVGVGRLRVDPRGSDLAALARAHNLLVRIDPGAARTLERILRAARDPGAAARMGRDPDVRQLLADPRVRALVADQGSPGSRAEEAQRLLEEDPQLRALIERLKAGGVDVAPDR